MSCDPSCGEDVEEALQRLLLDLVRATVPSGRFLTPELSRHMTTKRPINYSTGTLTTQKPVCFGRDTIGM